MRFVFPVVLKGCRDDSQCCVLIAVLLGFVLIDVSLQLLVCSCVFISGQVPLDISRSVWKVMKVIQQRRNGSFLVIKIIILKNGHCFFSRAIVFTVSSGPLLAIK